MCTQDNVKPFGGLSRDEKIALITAWVDGEVIEGHDFSGDWVRVLQPAWVDSGKYRVKSQEPDYVNWEMIDEEYKWYGRDEDGDPYLFTHMAKTGKRSFYSDTGRYTKLFKSLYKNNGCNWQDSLQQRPKKGK